MVEGSDDLVRASCLLCQAERAGMAFVANDALLPAIRSVWDHIKLAHGRREFERLTSDDLDRIATDDWAIFHYNVPDGERVIHVWYLPEGAA